MTKAVIFASKLGKTRKTATHIAHSLGADLFDLKKQTIIDIGEYDHIIFGTGITAGKPSGAVVKFIDEHKKELASKRRSLFITCVMDGENGTAQCERVSKTLDIADSIFFPGKRNKDGCSEIVDKYIATLKS